MGMKDDVLALAEELDGVSFKENCDQCLACGTALCRGDMECAESVHKACAKQLRAIVEHDAEDVTTVSAYDLLPDDDRKAVEWVRYRTVLSEICTVLGIDPDDLDNMYGIELVQEVDARCTTDEERKIIDWVLEHGGLDEVEKRLMPEGMEWPRYEDDEPVRIGDEVVCNSACSPANVGVIEFGISGNDELVCQLSNDRNFLISGGVLRAGERVKRPAPKVLDADGVEIKPGDEVWYEGGKLTVCAITDYGRVRVRELPDYMSLNSDCLTHEQPDTWERLEEDALMEVFDYVEQRKPEVSEFTSISVDKCIDLVRRARKLAGGAR